MLSIFGNVFANDHGVKTINFSVFIEYQTEEKVLTETPMSKISKPSLVWKLRVFEPDNTNCEFFQRLQLILALIFRFGVILV